MSSESAVVEPSVDVAGNIVGNLTNSGIASVTSILQSVTPEQIAAELAEETAAFAAAKSRFKERSRALKLLRRVVGGPGRRKRRSDGADGEEKPRATKEELEALSTKIKALLTKPGQLPMRAKDVAAQLKADYRQVHQILRRKSEFNCVNKQYSVRQ